MTAAPDLEAIVLAPLVGIGRRFLFLAAALLAVVLVGAGAYALQLAEGLRVTGMADTQNKQMYGIYIINFVFFIGISHAGTLISAILRVTKAEWRLPITRMAEFITVVALTVGGLMPIIDLGRPDRLLNLLMYGRWNSPILWDFFSITTYLFGSLIYLFIPLIPDLALCRDRLAGRVSPPKRAFYEIFSVRWRGTPLQWRRLATALTVMMVVIIPVAVSVHTVVSWIFAMTLRVGWNTAVFGAYFVAGAIFSGTATLILVMAILRRTFRLHAVIADRQFTNLGLLLAGLSGIMLYFNLSELVTVGYKLEEGEGFFLDSILVGAFAPWFWAYILGLASPAILMLVPKTRSFWGVIVAAVVVDVAMWIERYIIVVATLRVPQMPYTDLANYLPSAVELAITAGAFALFALLIAAFTKIVPIVSVWELRHGAPASRAAPEAMPAAAAVQA
ncbi:MAG: polysulfide reductase NrfD [Chloroflexi bacterium]|nr:polysulfide reductase NrfD [Chloroflexota bacterium]